MWASARVAEAGAGWWYVSKENEAGMGTEWAMANGANIIGWAYVGTEAGTGTERAGAERVDAII